MHWLIDCNDWLRPRQNCQFTPFKSLQVFIGSCDPLGSEPWPQPSRFLTLVPSLVGQSFFVLRFFFQKMISFSDFWTDLWCIRVTDFLLWLPFQISIWSLGMNPNDVGNLHSMMLEPYVHSMMLEPYVHSMMLETYILWCWELAFYDVRNLHSMMLETYILWCWKLTFYDVGNLHSMMLETYSLCMYVGVFENWLV
jgi:hypothetical protein